MSWTLVQWQWHSKSSNDNSSSITASGGMQNYNANKMTIQKPHAKRGWFLLHIVSKTNKYDQNRLQLTSKKKLFFDSAWWEYHLKHAWFRLNWCPIILRNIPEPCWISTRVTSENEIIKSLYNFLDLDTSESQVSSVLRFFQICYHRYQLILYELNYCATLVWDTSKYYIAGRSSVHDSCTYY